MSVSDACKRPPESWAIQPAATRRQTFPPTTPPLSTNMPRRYCRLVAPILVLFATVHIAVVAASDWPTFRGADRTAVSKDVGLLTEWPAGGPPLVWKAE